MSKAVPARLKFPTPVSRLEHFQKWLAALGSRITVRWHKHSCDLYVFEHGHRAHKSNFDQARIFLSGVDEGRRDYAVQIEELRNGLELLRTMPARFCGASCADHMQDVCECETLSAFAAQVLKNALTVNPEPQPIAQTLRKEETTA